ncbi:hypothetical protein KM043_008924 [Ampulex compressa]|nr:hypothetical protein KM043_008924 [Ampulex compressa]
MVIVPAVDRRKPVNRNREHERGLLGSSKESERLAGWLAGWSSTLANRRALRSAEPPNGRVLRWSLRRAVHRSLENPIASLYRAPSLFDEARCHRVRWNLARSGVLLSFVSFSRRNGRSKVNALAGRAEFP